MRRPYRGARQDHACLCIPMAKTDTAHRNPHVPIKDNCLRRCAYPSTAVGATHASPLPRGASRSRLLVLPNSQHKRRWPDLRSCGQGQQAVGATHASPWRCVVYGPCGYSPATMRFACAAVDVQAARMVKQVNTGDLKQLSARAETRGMNGVKLGETSAGGRSALVAIPSQAGAALLRVRCRKV